MAERTDINTRVGVLENSVETLRTTVESGRVETRQGFVEIAQTLNSVRNELSSLAGRSHPTNWLGIATAVGVTVGVFTAFFSLAEWRVGVTADPFQKTMELARRTADRQAEQIIELRVEHGILKDRLRRQENSRSDVTAR